ncbi:MAG: hypothetical protein ACI8V2_004213 [Candidatus Latescibacterota bacterium]|jgi:hypothetical protein
MGKDGGVEIISHLILDYTTSILRYLLWLDKGSQPPFKQKKPRGYNTRGASFIFCKFAKVRRVLFLSEDAIAISGRWV